MEGSTSSGPGPATERETGRRTQAQRRASTERALLDAAADVVVGAGVQALTLARVGQRAGYSRGIVTHHFGSKQAMLEALAKAAQEELAAAVRELDHGLERLMRLVERYLAAMDRPGRRPAVFLLLWAQAATDPELAELLRERDDFFREQVHDDVVAGQADGTIRGDVEPADVAVALVGELRGIGLQHLLSPSAVDLPRLQRTLSAHWRRALT